MPKHAYYINQIPANTGMMLVLMTLNKMSFGWRSTGAVHLGFLSIQDVVGFVSVWWFLLARVHTKPSHVSHCSFGGEFSDLYFRSQSRFYMFWNIYIYIYIIFKWSCGICVAPGNFCSFLQDQTRTYSHCNPRETSIVTTNISYNILERM